MKAAGLYNPQFEHDNCGVGAVADIAGKRSHTIVEHGLTILKNLIHRGAVGGDGVTGDGAGMLTQLPYELFAQAALSFDTPLPPAGEYGVAMLFLPQQEEQLDQAIALVEAGVRAMGGQIVGWREVPLDTTVLGEIAAQSLPTIRQLFVTVDNLKEEALERKLYEMRKDIEKRAYGASFSLEDIFVCSLSSQTIVYKGMLVGKQTGEFFLDLVNPDYRSALVVIHQRYSTNTFPSWALAQPFRMVAHNGEINTINGNIKRMKVREHTMASPLFNSIEAITPTVLENSSDSGSFDNVFELLVRGGRSMEHAMMMMVPEPFGSRMHISRDKRDFYLYHSAIMEPWDGPAALVFSDGKRIGATIDRNGLRPARYTITKDGLFVVGSETGVLEFTAEEVLKKGKLRPGKMIMVDTEAGRIVYDREIKSRQSRQKPYRRWLEKEQVTLTGLFHRGSSTEFNPKALMQTQHTFGYTKESLAMIKTMAENAQEPMGSMGNDTPLPALMRSPQPLSHYFRQSFAQVTNPPIDPYREGMMMSLMSFIGREGNLLEESPLRCRQLKLEHPVLTNVDITRLLESDLEKMPIETISLCYKSSEQLQESLERIQKEVEAAIDDGASIIILSHRQATTLRNTLPIPALLAVAAVNTHLVSVKKRHKAGIIVETAEVVDTMNLALLVGFGASAVNPYGVFETIAESHLRSTYESVDIGVDNYIQGLKKGLLKIMSKMGVSTIRSYRGGMLFEAIGLSQELVDTYFPGLTNRAGALGISEIEEEIRERVEQGNSEETLAAGGLTKVVKGGIPHLLTPRSVKLFHNALAEHSLELYQEFGASLHSSETPFFIRDLLTLQEAPIALSEVEPVEAILKRFSGGAMSLGSLSRVAHETIAQGCNSLGIQSNSGEGGESPTRGKSDAVSKIRQIASGRFGVTLDYLLGAEELQIKLAQGAKPGEGGQLPGKKVTPLIAEVRNATPGVTLISPPPHHDIYSIEDLAQLIYDLRSVNPQAKITVKLASEAGVGTVAAGVVKAGADSIIISGHDGGTGASPLSSIFTTGTPWEIGLSEVRQTLQLNNFRDAVELQVDGKLFTGEDIVKAAILGADRFGFATGLMMAVGCVMCRGCHKNTCSVGIATQDTAKIARFKGTAQNVAQFLTFIAEDTRQVLARMGKKSLGDVIGHIELLSSRTESSLDTTAILTTLGKGGRTGFSVKEVHGDKELIKRLSPAITQGNPMEIEAVVTNRERSVGAALSAAVYKQHGMDLPAATITCHFRGYGGQSFGAFLAPGIDFRLEGEANDYLAKGMCGGRITVTPPAGSFFRSHDSVIAGNVVLFGATGGELYLNGVAGERFAVRNSGAKAVVSSVGDHCCEYMTGGVVVVLDRTGVNFGAGMSGGVAYVLDRDQLFDTRCNLELVDLEPVDNENDKIELKELITNHSTLTGSSASARILEDWDEMLPQFVKVTPIEYRKALERMDNEITHSGDNARITDEIIEHE